MSTAKWQNIAGSKKIFNQERNLGFDLKCFLSEFINPVRNSLTGSFNIKVWCCEITSSQSNALEQILIDFIFSISVTIPKPIAQFMLEVVRYNKQEKPIKESKVSVTFCPDGLTTPKKFKLRLWLNKTKMIIMMSTLIRKPNLQKVWHFFYYPDLSNKRAGPNKGAGSNKRTGLYFSKQINKRAGLHKN